MVIMWEVFKAHPNCSKYRNGGMILVIQALVLFLGGFHGSNLVGSAFGAESFGGIVPITALGANCDGRHECVLENRFVPISPNSTLIHLKWKVLAILEEMMYDYVLYYFNVEMRGIEPRSGHIFPKTSTCLVSVLSLLKLLPRDRI